LDSIWQTHKSSKAKTLPPIGISSLISPVRFRVTGTQTAYGFIKSLRTDQLKVREMYLSILGAGVLSKLPTPRGNRKTSLKIVLLRSTVL